MTYNPELNNPETQRMAMLIDNDEFLLNRAYEEILQHFTYKLDRDAALRDVMLDIMESDIPQTSFYGLAYEMALFAFNQVNWNVIVDDLLESSEERGYGTLEDDTEAED